MQARYLVSTAIVFLLAAVAYFPSLDVPFYLDDYSSIVNNTVIKNADWSGLLSIYPMRVVGYASFALNELYLGGDINLYHVVNFVIHIVASLGVFVFASQIATKLQLDERNKKYFQIIAMGMFLLAPLNTQAIVYIVQRLASLTALFYIWGLVFFVWARISHGWKRYLYSVGVICFFISGMLTKQNMATFPLAIVVLELSFFESWFKKYFMSLFIFSLCATIFLVLIDYVNGAIYLSKLDSFLNADSQLTRSEYFSHQLVILWVYTFKFFIPFPLLLEYSPIPFTWGDWEVWLAAICHLVIIGIALKLYKSHFFISISIGLYYLLHAIESSFIPIYDLAFEHRAYLPNVMLSMLTAYLLVKLKVNYPNVVFKAFLPASIMIVFTVLTFQRNTLWTEPMNFYRHELTYTSDNSRAYASVAALYAQQGRVQNAEKWYKMSIQVAEETGFLQADTLISYIKTLYQQGNKPAAMRMGAMALKVMKRRQDRAKVLTTLARFHVDRGSCEFALGMLQRALTLDPNNTTTQQLINACSA